MNRKEFARRRRQIMRMMGKGGIAILPTAETKLRNRDVEYGYRPDSDFFYMTGFSEPESVAVLVPGRPHGEYLLFCRERDPERETWDGVRAGPGGAVADFGADDAFPIADIDDILPGLIEQSERVYYTMGTHPEFDQRVLGWINKLRAQAGRGLATPGEFVALDHLLHDMRLYKSRAEVAVMRRSARIAAAAHRRGMQACRPGMMEYELEAEYLHEFRKSGAQTSYQPIVGAGANACVLHYVTNADQVEDGDLVLVDAGCELECYASDITRTFPANGCFSKAQREVYDVVLSAQEAAIKKVRAGNHWDEPHVAAVRAITRGLVKLGLLKGRLPTLIKEEAYKPFYMHRTGHWLGMDVHDVGDYKVDGEWRLLEPGMVLTVEPGIYIPPGAKGIPKRYQGIGVRIEDDVLVTRGDPEILSSDVPKLPEDIEALMRAV
jgi:Xaa-Pro aminopeptidase